MNNTLKLKIIKLLSNGSIYTAKEMTKLIPGSIKSEINDVLYSCPDIFSRDSKLRWNLRTVDNYDAPINDLDQTITAIQLNEISSHNATVTDANDKNMEILVSGYEIINGEIVRCEDNIKINDALITNLKLTARVVNVLKKNEIFFCSQLIGCKVDTLLNMPGFGETALKSLSDNLQNYLKNASARACTGEKATSVSKLTSFDPNVLDNKYVVIDGKIIRRIDNALVADDSISALGLSARARNCMNFHGITKISQLVNITFEKFRHIKNLGLETSNEIIEKLEMYLNNHLIKNMECENFKFLLMDKILSFFDNNPFIKINQEQAINIFCDEEANSVISAINSLVEKEDLIFENGIYSKLYPSFYDVLQRILETATESERRSAEILLMRSQGYTLDEIGHTMNITQTRVRQLETNIIRKILKKTNGYFYEDKYAYLIENYAVSNEVLLECVNNDKKIIYYLSVKYIKGTRDLEHALTDSKVDLEIRQKIKQCICKDYLLIDGDRIPLNRKDIEDLVLKKYCANGCSYDEFCDIYNKFVLSRNLSVKYTKSLLISDDVKHSRNNQLSASKKLLWSQNQHMRFYDIDSVDYTELLTTLNLSQYENVEISTLMFMNRYPEMMKKYDIRNEYELHNFLRKIEATKENSSLVFGRMPTLIFGDVDRERKPNPN